MNFPLKPSPLQAAHHAAGARLAAFTGWELPADFGSPHAEHLCVRQAAGLFDLSHLTQLDVSGTDAVPYLRRLLANDVLRMPHNGATLYSCMLNERGCILDDFIVHRISEGEYRLIGNAANDERDIRWMRRNIAATGANVALAIRRDLALISIQGPEALERAMQAIPEMNTSRGLPAPFEAVRLADLFIARTGFTGEDGLEISVPIRRSPAMWQALLKAGIRPCGMLARESLRLEAGFRQYGRDMDDMSTPLDSGMVHTLDLSDPERDFCGRQALENDPWITNTGGLIFHADTPSPGMVVHTAQGRGFTTSAAFSPILGQSIALARLPDGTQPGDEAEIEVQGQRIAARVVKPPFVLHGQARD